ncbi:MAG: hypothetical protein V3V15_03725 [Sphingorhabdus sp.]
MSLTKALIVAALFVIAFNLFYYARYQRAMADVRRRAAEEAEAGEGESEKGEADDVT